MSKPVDSAEVLLTHNRWANRQLLAACDGLTDEQLDTPFEMGLGSLRPTVTHILGAMRGWTDVLARTPMRDRIESGGPYGPARWNELEPIVDAELTAAALSGSPDDVLQAERAGKMYEFVRSHIVVHITTHGVHHRAQCLNMLRRLSVEPLPKSSVMEWTFTP